MSEFRVGFKTKEQQDFASLVLDSLKSVETIINMSKNNTEISFEENEEGLLTVLYAASGSWLGSMIDNLEKHYLNKEDFYINRKDFLIVKYFTEMYWHHTGSYDIYYKGFDIESIFENFEENKSNLKNILKVVK